MVVSSKMYLNRTWRSLLQGSLRLLPHLHLKLLPINDVLTIIDDDANVEETNFASSEETGEDVVVKHIPVTVDEDVPVEDEIFEVVEENPQFLNGGTVGLLQYLSKNIKYPTIPQEEWNPGACNSTVCCEQGW